MKKLSILTPAFALVCLTALVVFADDTVITEIKTNVVTQWLPIERVGTNGVRQIGFLTTNRVMEIVHDGRTNVVLLKQLGRDEFPTQKNTNVNQGGPRGRMVR